MAGGRGVWRRDGWIAAGGGLVALTDPCGTGAAIMGVQVGRVFRCALAQGHNNTRPEWAGGVRI